MTRLFTCFSVLGLLLLSCSRLSTGVIPSPGTGTALPAPAVTSIPYIPFTSCPEGIYFAYREQISGDRYYLSVMTGDGEHLGYLA